VFLQLSEGGGKFQERGTIPKVPGFALKHRQIVPPIVNCPWWKMMAAFDDPQMFAQDTALGRHDQSVGIDPQADRTVREGRRNAIAIALEADQTGR
jgi:hypothetical protein